MGRDRVMIAKDGTERLIVGENTYPGESDKFYRPTEAPAPSTEEEDPLVKLYKRVEDELVDKVDGFIDWINKKRGRDV